MIDHILEQIVDTAGIEAAYPELADPLQCINGPSWKTKDGRMILLTDLADPHLLNILKMVRRNALVATAKGTIELLGACPSGEMAQEAVAFEQRERERLTWRKFDGVAYAKRTYEALLDEALSRDSIAADAVEIDVDDCAQELLAYELQIMKRAMS